MLSIKRYREIMKDNISSDAEILERLKYLKALCENVIDIELEKYSKTLR
mgnify:CR=1 FL=1